MVLFFLTSEVVSDPLLKRFGVDVGLNKCLFNLVGLKDNVMRNTSLILTWDVPSSLVEALGLDCHGFASVLFIDC